MAKLNAQIDVDVPRDFLVYDLGSETLTCNVCSAHATVRILSDPDLDQAPRVALYSVFKEFAKSHVSCVLKGRPRHNHGHGNCRGGEGESKERTRGTARGSE